MGTTIQGQARKDSVRDPELIPKLVRGTSWILQTALEPEAVAEPTADAVVALVLAKALLEPG